MKPWRRAKRWRSGRKARSQKNSQWCTVDGISWPRQRRSLLPRNKREVKFPQCGCGCAVPPLLVCCAALCVPPWVHSVQKSAGGSDSEQLVIRSRRPFTGRCVPECAHARGEKKKKHTHMDESAGAAGWACYGYCTFCSLLFCSPVCKFTNERHIFIRQLMLTL